ncbi:MAG TPA: hypothetical protein VF691_14855, partial [Cytophagaceae bacterium]
MTKSVHLGKMLRPLNRTFIWMLTLSVGCFPKPLEIEVAPSPEKLVISSQLIPDRGIVIAVTRSVAALECCPSISDSGLRAISVTDAEVIVSSEGKTDTLQKSAINPGIYFSNILPRKEGEVYLLTVTDAANSQKVHSKSTLLPKVEMDSIYFKSDTLFNVNFTTAHLSFKDP